MTETAGQPVMAICVCNRCGVFMFGDLPDLFTALTGWTTIQRDRSLTHLCPECRAYLDDPNAT